MIRRLLALALMLVVLLLTACGQNTPTPQTQRLAIQVDQTGIHRLTAADLRQFSWDLTELGTAEISLSRGDTPVPFQLTGTDHNRELRFYGHVAPNRYSQHAIYNLSLQNGSGLVLVQRAITSDGDAPRRQSPASLRIESNTNYQTQAAEIDPWVGDRLFAPAELSMPITIPNPADAPASMVIQIWAASAAPVEPDHHLLYHLNGQQIGEDSWDNKGFHQSALTIPAGLLKDGENTLTINAPGDTEARAELAYVDWVELTYERMLDAENDTLAFEGGAGSYQINGFGEDDIALWDVSKPDLPQQLTGFAVTRQERNHQVNFQDDAGSVVSYFSGATPLTPASIEPAPERLQSPSAGADYLVITHPDLQQALQPLIEHRQTQGLRTAVITTDQIYDRFSGGLPTPTALTDFLRWATETWPAPAPSFVLLAGDASYDPLDYTSGPYQNLVPTALRATQEMGETASDNALADIDGDGLPDLAIGRFPAQTPEQLSAMIAKTLAYEQDPPAGDWLKQALFVADNDDPFFSSFNSAIVSGFPATYETEQLVIGNDGDVRSQLLAALNEGRRLVSYMGHGAVNIWAQEEVLTNADIANLEQEGRLPFVVVWACLSGYFHHPQTESLGETLLLSENSGAVAALVPTGQTFPNNQQILADALFNRYLFQTPTIGEAFNASLHELNPQHPGERDIINTFVLLGDPALRLFPSRNND